MIPHSVDGAFKAAFERFQAAKIDTARLDARLLLGAVLGGGVERVLAQSGTDLSLEQADTFENFVQRRESFEPISQILGVREFWSLSFKVTPATLTPRPDSETLVEASLDSVDEPPKRILDLGTGSGCLLLALLSEWKNTEGLGLDRSDEALQVALENSETLGFSDRADFVCASWRDDDWQHGLFDMVVSNPPYIPDGDIENLDEDVKGFEPLSALAGGLDGLDAYKEIIAVLPKILVKGGLVVFEVGVNQAKDVTNLLLKAGFDGVQTRQDLSGIDRAVLARLKKA